MSLNFINLSNNALIGVWSIGSPLVIALIYLIIKKFCDKPSDIILKMGKRKQKKPSNEEAKNKMQPKASDLNQNK